MIHNHAHSSSSLAVFKILRKKHDALQKQLGNLGSLLFGGKAVSQVINCAWKNVTMYRLGRLCAQHIC